MSSNIIIISFYYPNPKIGGAQLLFARIAEYLEKAGFQVKIYEETECYISTYLKVNNVSFIRSIEKNERGFIVGKGELFLLSLSYTSLIYRKFDFDSSSKFIFWDLHPNCLIEQLAFSGIYKKISNRKIASKLINVFDRSQSSKIESLINLGSVKNGIVFMSEYNLNINKSLFKLTGPAKMLPIPLPINNNEGKLVDRKVEHTDIVRIGWISRLARDKNNILSLLIDDIKGTQNTRIELVVIGDGPDKNYIVEYANKKNLNNVKFTGIIPTEHLQEYISNNIDLGFSMGTSALEFALAGIPTVLVPSPTEFNFFQRTITRYSWLHNVTGMEVNTYRGKIHTCQSFSSIIEDYLIDQDLFRREVFNYVFKNHGIESVTNELINMINLNDFTLKDLLVCGLSEKSLFARAVFKIKHIYKNTGFCL